MAKRKNRGASFGGRKVDESKQLRRQAEQRTTIMYTLAGVGAIALMCLLAWFFTTQGDSFAGLGGGDDTGSASTSTDNDNIGGNEAQAITVSGDRPLAGLDPAQRDGYYDSYPDMMLEDGVDYQAIIRTVNGDISLDLFEDESPLAVNNFVFLANQGFYDDVTFHRVLSNFMAQGGDPAGNGRGGPGYEFDNENDPSLSFDRRGLLAMANAGPNTNGSQFFITFGPSGNLNGGYTIFGELIDGDDALSSITLRDPQRNPDFTGDVIERIDIVEN